MNVFVKTRILSFAFIPKQDSLYQSLSAVNCFVFFSTMATPRHEKKLAAMKRQNTEDRVRNIQTRNTNSPGIRED